MASLLCRRGVGLAAAALLGAAGLASSASAQCGNYLVTQTTGTIVPGTTDIGNHCDDCGTPVTLPFSISFYGTSYSSVTVSSNGYINFNPADNAAIYNENTYCVPYATLTGAVMFPGWTDGYTTNAGFGIFTGTTGVAPNRTFNIEWRTQYYPGNGSAGFEVALHEGQPGFDFIYGTATNGYNSSIGCQSPGNTASTAVQCTQPLPAAGTVLHFDCPTTFPPSCNLSTNPGSANQGSSFTALATVLSRRRASQHRAGGLAECHQMWAGERSPCTTTAWPPT